MIPIYLYLLFQTSAQPVFFIAVTRHGSRSPEKFVSWDTQERWPEGPGMLTPEGLRQEYLLGVYLKQRYHTTHNLLSNQYRPEELEIYSTNFNRTHLSAKGLISGLFQGTKISQRKQINLPLDNINLSKYRARIDVSQTVPVYMDSEKIHGMLIPQVICKEYKEHIEKGLETKEMKRIYLEYDDVIMTLANYLKTNRKQAQLKFDSFYDSVYCNEFMGFEVPAQFTGNWLKRASKLHVEKYMYLKHSPEYFAKYAGNLLLLQVFKHLQDKLNGKSDEKKGVIYSAHDSSIQNLLVSLNLFDWKHPPLASMLLIELVKNEDKMLVRLLYNNQELYLPGNTQTSDFLQFQEYVKRRTFSDDALACRNIAYFVETQEVTELETSYLNLVILNSFLMISAVLGINYLIKNSRS